MNKPMCIVLKLRSGETLFAELLSETSTDILLTGPLSVLVNSKDGLSLSEWIPYSVEQTVTLKNDDYFFRGNLSDKYRTFYGSVILQSSINKIKEDVAFEMSSNNNDYYSILEGLERMKAAIKDISEKFDLGEESLDLSRFEDHLKNNKPVTH